MFWRERISWMERRTRLFRRNSLERISSPEQFDDYLKVTHPALWITLTAFLFFIAGIFIWCVFGRVTTTKTLTGKAVDGVVSICAEKKEIGRLQAGDEVTILDEETIVLSVTEDTEQEGKMLVIFRTNLPDGEYPVRIVTEVIAPYTFLFSTEE